MPSETPEAYFDKFARMGGIVEEFIDGAGEALALEPAPPQPQRARSWPSPPTTRSWAGPCGQVFLGCSFPAADDYRLAIQEAGLAIGAGAGQHGVVSRFAIDFLVHRAGPGRGLEGLRPRDQPADGRHHPPLPRPAVPDRRQPRPRHRPLPLPHRPREVLPRHRQPALRDATAASCPRTWSRSSPSTSCTTATAASPASCSTSSARSRSSASSG